MNSPIRLYRETHNLTLEAFGALVGVQKAAVNKWENGSLPSIASAKLIEARTAGAITRQQLRPDVWTASDAPSSLDTASAA